MGKGSASGVLVRGALLAMAMVMVLARMMRTPVVGKEDGCLNELICGGREIGRTW